MIPRDVNAVGWAEMEENIGDALILLVERHGGTDDHLKRARKAYLDAFEVFQNKGSTFNAEKCGRKLEKLESGDAAE